MVNKSTISIAVILLLYLTYILPPHASGCAVKTIFTAESPDGVFLADVKITTCSDGAYTTTCTIGIELKNEKNGNNYKILDGVEWHKKNNDKPITWNGNRELTVNFESKMKPYKIDGILISFH